MFKLNESEKEFVRILGVSIGIGIATGLVIRVGQHVIDKILD